MKLVLLIAACAACQRTERPPDPGSAASPPGGRPAPAAAYRVPEDKARPIPPLPDPLPGQRRDMAAIVGGAARIAIADLDGDGHPELVLVDAEAIRVVDRGGHELARAPVAGGIEVLSAADLDGDHRAELLAMPGRASRCIGSTGPGWSRSSSPRRRPRARMWPR
jgi:hypothetical protein